jgi:N-acetyl-anhydromuramyl-L-alanine amidase AmpD
MLPTLLLAVALQQPLIVKRLFPKTHVRDTTQNYIVIHNDGANLNASATRLILRVRKLSYHYFIGRDGKIYQFMDISYVAKHAGISNWNTVSDMMLNSYSIGICLQGTDITPYTNKQYASLSKLINYLYRRYPDSQDKPILTHAEVAIPYGRKTDPGIFFDTTKLNLIRTKKERL